MAVAYLFIQQSDNTLYNRLHVWMQECHDEQLHLISLEADRRFTLGSAVDALAKQVENIQPQPQKVSILAFATGAYVAAVYAARYPQKVEHLLLVAPNIDPERILRAMLERSAKYGGIGAEQQLDNWKRWGSAVFEEDQHTHALILKADGNGQQRYDYEYYKNLETMPSMPIFQAPATIIAPLDDIYTTPNMLKEYQRRLEIAGNQFITVDPIDDDHRCSRLETEQILKQMISENWFG